MYQFSNVHTCVFLSFLNVKIQEGDAHNIFCPAYECYQLVPVHVIESVVSREMDQRYLQFDIKVEKHHTLICTSLFMSSRMLITAKGIFSFEL